MTPESHFDHSSEGRANSGRRPAARIESLQMLRGIAVLMVLTYHMGGYELKSGGDYILGPHAKTGAAGVDLFFVISGFVMITISNRIGKGDERPGEFLLRRFFRIYPLYWFYTAIAFAVFRLSPNLANREGGISATSPLKSLLLFPDTGAPLVGQGWTLIHEMYFYIGFGLILLGRKENRGKWLAAWAAVIVVVCYFWQPSWNALSPAYKVCAELIFNPLTLEFLGGCMLAFVAASGFKRMGKASFMLGLALLVISVFLPGSSWRRELVYGIPAMMIVYGSVSMEKSYGNSGPDFLKVIGDASYSIYLSHIFCLSVCLLAWKPFRMAGMIDNIFFLFLAVIACLCGGIFSYRFIEVPMQRMSRRILSGSHPSGKHAP